ncbi:MAG TPA: DNA polymerase III subunit delta [Vicinamibacterales bacterium]|nr:DNA polymerase III subunit delta [Vicinamibacterales bacterium]
MPRLSLSELRKQIASGQTRPLYALIGADDAEKSAIAAEFGDMVDEGLRAFNVERMYGGDTTVKDLADAACTLPMLATRRVVIVLEAEKLLAPKRSSQAVEEEQERLEAFLESPPDHASVVFVCGLLDMRRRVVKQLLKQAQIVDCGSIENEADAERWVRARAARDNVALDPAAARALVERTGPDLVRLRAGLERVALFAMGRAVTRDDVRLAVAPGPESQADFGIAKAIWRNDVRDALKELGLSLEAGSPPFMVLGQLRVAAEKQPAPQVKTSIEAVFRTDLAIKSSAGDERVLLERLVVELCAPPARQTAFANRAERRDL